MTANCGGKGGVVRHLLSSLWLLLILGPASVSCSSEVEESEADRLFRQEVQPIFEEKCNYGCHMPEGYAEFMPLGEDFGADTIVNLPSMESDLDIIEPGSPEQSYMWHKLNGTHLEVGGEGDPMPPQPGPLSEDSLAKIEEWILAL